MKLSKYRDELSFLRMMAEQREFDLAMKYAKSKGDHKKGDIVADHIGHIIVDDISIDFTFAKEPSFVYTGPVVNKNGKPRKNGGVREVWQVNLITGE